MGHPRATALAIALLAAGCAELPESALGDGSRGVVAPYPDDGAAGIPVAQAPFVDVGHAEPDDLVLEAFLIPDGQPGIELTCTPSGDRARHRCDPPGPLQEDTTYTLQVELAGGGTGPVSTRFTTRAPQGLAYEVGTAMHVERLGGGGTAEALGELLCSGTPALLVLEEVAPGDAPPLGYRNWVWGPAVALPGEAQGTHAVQQGVGYPFALVADVAADGTISGHGDHAFLQVEVDDVWHQVRVDDVRLSGHFKAVGDLLLTCDLALEAVLPRISVERLADRAGEPAASLIWSQLELDVDTDGDGSEDGARLRLRTCAAPAEVQQP